MSEKRTNKRTTFPSLLSTFFDKETDIFFQLGTYDVKVLWRGKGRETWHLSHSSENFRSSHDPALLLRMDASSLLNPAEPPPAPPSRSRPSINICLGCALWWSLTRKPAPRAHSPLSSSFFSSFLLLRCSLSALMFPKLREAHSKSRLFILQHKASSDELHKNNKRNDKYSHHHTETALRSLEQKSEDSSANSGGAFRRESALEERRENGFWESPKVIKKSQIPASG